MSATTKRPYAAGIWEQSIEREDGIGFVAWSTHKTDALARRAALRYAQSCSERAGGVLTWAGGVRAPDGTVTWYGKDGVRKDGAA